MARSFDIVEFVPSDGLTPLQIKKLNWNFRKVANLVGQVDVDQGDAVKGLVIKTTDLAADQKLTVSKSGTKSRTVLNFGIPAAQVRITDAQVDSVLADDAPTGDSILNLTGLSRFWAGVKQYVDNAIGAIGSFVLKTGDTMTGDLKIVKDDARLWIQPKKFDHDGGAPSASLYQRVVEVFDKDGDTIGMIEEVHRDDGRIGLTLSAVRKVGGTYKYNQITPYIADDGTLSYGVASPAAFRTAIDAAPTSHNHAASNITSGTLALARGGTASDNTARAINTVFAGPSSGSAGNASWRSLVAADIPNLNASKITAGTLARARGGTAVDNSAISPNRVLAGPSSGTNTGNATFRALVAADIPNLNASKITAGSLDPARGGTGRSSAQIATKTIFSGVNVAPGSNLGTNTDIFDYRIFIVKLSNVNVYLFGYRTGSTSSAGYLYAGNSEFQDVTGGDKSAGCKISVSTAGLCKVVAAGYHKLAAGASITTTQSNVTGVYGLY